MLEKKYKTIRWILKQQIESKLNYKWAWNKGIDEEFICVYNYIPKWSTELYTANQLLNKIDEK